QQRLDPAGRRHRDEHDQQQAEEQDVERQPPDEVHRVPDEDEEGGDGTVAVARAGLVHCMDSMEIKLTVPRRSAPWARWALPGKPSRPWGAPARRIGGRYGRIARAPPRFHAPSVTV